MQAGRIAYPRRVMRQVLQRTDASKLPRGWAKGSPELEWLCIAEDCMPDSMPDSHDMPAALWLQLTAASAAPKFALGACSRGPPLDSSQRHACRRLCLAR